MAIALVKSASGTNTIATVSPAFASATTAGNLIVLAISGDNITSGVGSGWTQSANMSQVGNNGGYLWWRISTGETTVASYSLAGAANSTWVLAEFSGCSATPYDVSLGQHRESSNNAYTTPTLTPTTGNRVLVAAMLGSSGNVQTGPFTLWLNSFTAIAGTGQSGSGTKTCGALAYALVTGTGSATFSTGVTWPDNCSGQVGLIIAFKEAAGGNVTLTAAGGSYALTGSSAGLAGKAILDPGSYALTGTAAAFAYKQPATAGAYTLTGTAAGLTVSGNVTLGATAGSYTITGFSAGLAGKAILDPGAYSLTGTAAAFATTLFNGAGVYALTGSAASFEVVGGGFTLFCDPGAYTLTGSAASFPGNEPLPPVVTTPPGGNYTGAGRGRMIRRREKRKEDRRDEIEELIELIQAPPPVAPSPIAGPPPPALIDLAPKLQAAGLSPPQRKIVKRAIVSDDDDDDDEAVTLLLNLLS